MFDYLDADVAYLLGLIAARGQLSKNNGGWRLMIQVPHSYLETDELSERQRLIGSLNKIINRIGGLTGNNPTLTEGTNVTDISYESSRNTLFFRDLKLLLGDATGYENFSVPQPLFDGPDDVKREFLRGYGDIAAKVRKSNEYFLGLNRVYIDILSVNWKLPTQLCHLLQDHLKIPVQTLTWGHPNLRDKATKPWTKREHQVKVFCDAYLPIGFYLDHKHKQLEAFARKNRQIRVKGGPKPHECDPETKSRGRNPRHPDEGNADLPKSLRGKHFNGYREICTKIHCWRWEQKQKKQKRLPGT